MDIVVNANAPIPPIEERHSAQEPFYWNLLSLVHGGDHPIPLANFLARLHGRTEDDWIVVSPIHCQATHNDAFITAYGEGMGVPEDDSRACLSVVKNFLEEEVSEWLYHSPSLWLARLGTMPVPKSLEPHALFHQSLLPHLKNLDEQHAWLRLFTEIQMLLTTQVQREGHESAAINALWFWGQGPFAPQNKKIFCEDRHFASTLERLGFACIDTKLQADIIVVSNGEPSESLHDAMHNTTCSWYWNDKVEQIHAKTLWQRIRGIFS